MVVKTLRGLLADGGQDQLRLGTNKGKVGYRITKFDIFPNRPGGVDVEGTVKIYKAKQTTINALVDFTDGALLGAAYYTQYTAVNTTANTIVRFFDWEIFNQDIYVTSKEIAGQAEPMNYYIELEVIPLTDHAAEYATLKDIRTQRTIT